MNIINLGSYKGIYTRILEFKDNELLFETNNKIGEKYYYCINRYNIKDDSEIKIYSYEVSEMDLYSQYTNIVTDRIMIIKTHNKYRIEVDIIDRKTGIIKSNNFIETKEEIPYIPKVINRRYVLFSTYINENSIEYERYKEKGYDNCGNADYLYDLFDNKIYFIKDFRVIAGDSVELTIFRHNNEDYLIFNETYMVDWEYEDIYEYVQERKIDIKDIKDIEGLHLIRLDDFVNSIKNGEENIPFEEISKRHIDGWVRYFSMDENNIYYREKYFKTQIEKIIRIGKEDLKSTVVKEINHKDIEGRLVYDENIISSRIYEERTEKNILVVKGIYNCDYNISFMFDEHERRYVCFYDFIDNRYIIASGWYEEGDEDEDYYDIYYIIDTKENESLKVIGECEVYGDNVITY